MKLKQWQNIFRVVIHANPIENLAIQIKNGIIKLVNVNVKIIVHAKKIPSTCICENCKYLKSITDTSVIECDEVINFLDIVSTKKANTVATNVTSTASINCDSKKIKDGYILHKPLLVILLLLTVTIICYHYAK